MIPLPTILILLASSPAPADPSSYQAIGWLLLGLAGLAAAANQIMGLMEKFRTLRAPEPGDVSPDRLTALEARVSEMDRRWERRLDDVIGKLDSMTKTFGQVVADFNYTIGKIDGRTGD